MDAIQAYAYGNLGTNPNRAWRAEEFSLNNGASAYRRTVVDVFSEPLKAFYLSDWCLML